MADRQYELRFRSAALKELRALPGKIRGQVERTIDRLLAVYQTGQRPQDIRPIEGRADTWAIDSGEYRILYEVEESSAAGAPSVLRVWRIGHRRDVYRNL